MLSSINCTANCTILINISDVAQEISGFFAVAIISSNRLLRYVSSEEFLFNWVMILSVAKNGGLLTFITEEIA